MIDIVIPTLMKINTEALEYSLLQACKSKYVKNIFVIDNSVGASFNKTIKINNSKIKVQEMHKNIYVNPAWNLGVSLCESENVVIMNDDIFCETIVYKEIEELMSEESVGLCSVETIYCKNKKDYIENKRKLSYKNYSYAFQQPNGNMNGWFYCIKKKYWEDIPEGMNLWYGDNFIYKKIREKGLVTKCISNVTIGHIESATLNILEDRNKVIEKDFAIYRSIFPGKKQTLFIMPSVNRESITKAVDSLNKQKDKNWHLCIVYDNVENPIVKESDKIKCINLKEKLGMKNNSAGLVRNVAIDRFVDEYERIAFLDDDDQLDENYLQLVNSKYHKEDVVVLRMKNNKTQQVLPEYGTEKMKVAHVGISFCYKTSKAFQHRFTARDVEDAIFLFSLLSRSEISYTIADEIGYYVGE